MRRIPVAQRSPEWVEARRHYITATDIPALLGLSPYRCEADVAAEKQGADGHAETLRMRLGAALEPFIAAEYERETGRRLRRFGGMLAHPRIDWAAASPDYGTVGERRLVEIKWSGSRSRFADGLPQDVEAQVAWQLGVSGYPAADVAALVGDELRIFPLAADEALFANLVEVASDFRRRLAAGGPFTHNPDSLRRAYPADDGSEMAADDELAEAVMTLLAVRERRRALTEDEERLESAIKARMGDAAVLRGPGWRATWKRTKDIEQTDWRSVAVGLLPLVPEPERTALVGIHTTVRPGFRPFRVVTDKEV